MVESSLKRRLINLEHEAGVRRFTGYAVIDTHGGESINDAIARWQDENGSLESRQLILFNFGGFSPATWNAMLADHELRGEADW